MSGSHAREIRSNSKVARQQGASLLEGIAYLGIAAIVVMGAISLLTGAFSSAKSNQANEEVIGLRTAVRKLYMGQTYPTTGIPGLLQTAKAAPGTLASDGTTLKNSWGGTVDIAGSGTGFQITYPSVPKDVCVSMLSGANGWTSVQTNGGTTVTTFPVTAQIATTQCSAADNSIVYTSS
ncbi:MULTISPECIES: type 4 pilus major pilin [unclassified Herbaspirillum]|uniref:type 4 pilus major pilin n=1 Tax=unclassified Herbaspirillum TaxID=2624150 RepID=UPI0018121FD3|nr:MULTISPECIES: type 4 pilus major pilin [unclassified Herbaspirillum]MBB5391333.1 type II secretory pathway pseudopilin PulG [Herbaspirillum sp. SJZ102]